MSTLTLSLPQSAATPTREVTRRRLSLRRVEVRPDRQQASTVERDNRAAPSALATVKSAVARLEALVRDNRAAIPSGETAVPLDTLMGGANTLAILHNGEVYTLRKTRYGKLILTK
ncbi:hemin uptake protein HemP [Cupriavidus sp. AU9028]|uniref:hemin uptake protein HemP n=1 Tax=Cupriavidus sp. AU9028 TaxID=2871157 RepID=UPI001C93FB57|nr:hemin uptake protein HemP [Cupriavidus sp. AU9028]MBY4896317.1 hemin uptake protein HemP [Cupriavidus sp. AU9028]